MIECYEFVAGYKVLPTQPQHLILRYEVRDRQQTKEVKFVCYVDDDTFPLQKIAPTVPPILQLLELSKIVNSSWVLLCLDPLTRTRQFSHGNATIGQFIYWLAEDHEDFRDRRGMIMSFDMSSEQFKEVDLLDSLTDVEALPNLSISRLKEFLALVEYHKEFPWKRVCTVWVMEHGDSKAFTKLFTINAPNASVGWTMGFRTSGEPIIEMQHDGSGPTSLAVYEPCLEHIKDLGIYGNR
ncbi:hypothetical protein OSB04_028280 [Centaurea solstitialis]|uniref:F-box associated beta-propeller type 1 domain-containing protein n=1 Tax=Centaurea solstitialis TaxID=347529 RepID=A0AA38W933_9ASTR|nr:hypothetical protein OSB04_028280 [Centaurea solstitialis]